jgi:hypothetical protein
MTARGDRAVTSIYESDTIEALALIGEFDARIWAARFVEAVQRTPQLTTDEETMVAWFASAIMAGYDEHKAQVSKEQGPYERAELERIGLTPQQPQETTTP